MEGSGEVPSTSFPTARGTLVFNVQPISDLPAVVAGLKEEDGKCADLVKKSEEKEQQEEETARSGDLGEETLLDYLALE